MGENVRGLISWNGGLVFDEVQADLEAEGYTVIPCVLPACGVNAPHRRERVWFVAYRASGGWDARRSDGGRENSDQTFRTDLQYKSCGLGEIGITPNTNNARNTASRSGIVGEWTENIIERELAQSEFSGHGFTADTNDKRNSAGLGSVSETNGEIPERDENAEPCNASKLFAANSSSSGRFQNNIEQQTGEFEHACPRWDKFPTQPPICGGDDGLSRELDGITFPKWRSESIKAYGNAIVPAVAFEVFKAINEIDNFLNENSYLL